MRSDRIFQTIAWVAMLGLAQVAFGQRDDEPLLGPAPGQEGHGVSGHEHGGKAGQAWLGITLGEADAQSGIAVAEVDPAGPAAKAGLAKGDSILKAGGTQLSKADDLVRLIEGRQPRDQLELTIVHNGRQKQIQVILGEQPGPVLPGASADDRPPQREARRGPARERDEASGAESARSERRPAGRMETRRAERRHADDAQTEERDAEADRDDSSDTQTDEARRGSGLGSRLAEAFGRRSERRTERQAEREAVRDESPQREAWLGVVLNTDKESPESVTVARVFPSGPASRAGIEPGDTILEADGQEVKSAHDLVSLIDKKKPKDTLELTVRHDDGERETLKATLASQRPFLAQRRGGGEADEQESDPAWAVELEHARYAARQHQRIEQLVLQLRDEVRALRKEVEQLRDKRASATRDERRIER